MVDIVLFPSDYFDSTKVDPALRYEYDAVKSTGLFMVVLFEYDAFFNSDRIVLSTTVKEKRLAVYRGWMMKPEMYKLFYKLLMEKNIELITSPDAYNNMHIFPNVYQFVKSDTAYMETYPLHTHIDIENLKMRFTRFMVKDFVKSVKGDNFPKYFDQSISQEEFDRWMDVFYKYRGNLITGGICIKEFLNLKHYGDKTNEFRVFYINNKIATVCRNSNQGLYVPMPSQVLIEKYSNLKSPYYTVDYAELEDGSWFVIEAGDGSVSGLSTDQDYEQYFRTVYSCLNTDSSQA